MMKTALAATARRIVGKLVAGRAPPRFRDDLVRRLVRQTCRRFDRRDEHAEIFRFCIGASLSHELNDGELVALLDGVEAELGLLLLPPMMPA